MLLTEDRVKNAVLAYLSQRGLALISVKTLREQGVDITAKYQRYNRYFLIEVKGDPSPAALAPSSFRENAFVKSVGQIITRIHPERGYKYGLAYPSSYRELVIRRLPPTLLKKLNLNLFFVNESQQVEHLTWRDLISTAAKSRSKIVRPPVAINIDANPEEKYWLRDPKNQRLYESLADDKEH